MLNPNFPLHSLQTVRRLRQTHLKSTVSYNPNITLGNETANFYVFNADITFARLHLEKVVHYITFGERSPLCDGTKKETQ